MGRNPHDDVVLEVGLSLTSLGRVHADIDGAYMKDHEFAAKFVGLEPPDLLVSVYVPTQAVFAPRPALSNPDWREPDIAVTKDGRTYLLDVFDSNDSFPSVARKIETGIANAGRHDIAGFALVEKGAPPYRGRAKNLERLRRTFEVVVAAPSAGRPGDDVRCYLEPLLDIPAVRERYGTVDWNRTIIVSTGDPRWRALLVDHAAQALAAPGLLAGPPPGGAGFPDSANVADPEQK